MRLLSIVSTDRLQHVLRRGARRGRLPLAARPAGAVARPSRRAVPDRDRRRRVGRRLRAGRVAPRTSSAATPTGAGPSGSRSTTSSSSRSRIWDDWFGPDFRVEYPTGSGQQLRLRDVAARPRAPARLDLAARAGRPATRLRRLREARRRSRVARPAPVLRVLPRRHRGGPRRLAPDRLDRAGRAPALPRRRARLDRRAAMVVDLGAARP